MTSPTISSRTLAKLVRTLGVTGIEIVDDPEARVPLARLHDLWETVADESAALAVAQSYAPSDYGLLGFVAMTSSTLGHAIDQMIRHSRLWMDEPAIERTSETVLRLVYRSKLADRPGLRRATEAAMAQILVGGRAISGKPIAVREVSFTHAAPEDIAPFERFFGGPVRFGARANEMVLDAEILALPLPKAEPGLQRYLLDLAGHAIPADDAPLEERLRSAIAADLRNGVPDAASLAKRLGLGERTLRRRLAESGTSLRELVETTRADLARGYVREGKVPLCEVAFLLGFSETSAFHRAFKRWTGTTPAAFRKLSES